MSETDFPHTLIHFEGRDVIMIANMKCTDLDPDIFGLVRSNREAGLTIGQTVADLIEHGLDVEVVQLDEPYEG